MQLTGRFKPYNGPRLRLVVGLFGLSFCAIVLRLIIVQVFQHTSLGDFLKRSSLLTMQQLAGSKYPTWVSQDAAPSGSQPPALLSCPALSLFDTPYGSTPP